MSEEQTEQTQLLSEDRKKEILEKVQKAIRLSEDPKTPPHEADQAMRMADKLMTRYSIDAAMARMSMPAAKRMKPGSSMFDMGPSDENTGNLSWMAQSVAEHCRVKIRRYVAFDAATNTEFGKVYGFEPDVQYFNLLWTTVRLHMLGILNPRPDPNKTLEENCYFLHEIGYNWLGIAEMYGCRRIFKDEFMASRSRWINQDGKEVSETACGSYFKRAYLSEVKRLGTDHTKIAGGGSKTYRESAIEGYTAEIRNRLYRMSRDRDTDGSNLPVLKSAWDEVVEFFYEENPSMRPKVYTEEEKAAMAAAQAEAAARQSKRKGRTPKIKYRPVNEDAYSRGVAHAKTADLGGPKVGGDIRREVR